MEARLWGSMLGGLTFAVGSLIFAWAIKGHWIGQYDARVPDTPTAILTAVLSSQGPLIALALLIRWDRAHLLPCPACRIADGPSFCFAAVSTRYTREVSRARIGVLVLLSY